MHVSEVRVQRFVGALREEIRSGGKSRWRRGLRLVLKLGLEVHFRVAQRLNLGYSEHSGIADNPESANLTNLRT